jgi:hypothetical protein
MPRLDGEVFLFGTAMVKISSKLRREARQTVEFLREAGLIEERSRQG